MFSLQQIFPCYKYAARRKELIAKATNIETENLNNKKREFHETAIQFEETVKEFLNDRDRVEASRNEH